MISPEKALEKILLHTKKLEPQPVRLIESSGRILAQDIYAADNLPPFDNSAMDGFAIRAKDLGGASKYNPKKLIIRETIRAGALAKEELNAKEAMKIMTGAQLPKGADCVVMVEKTETGDDGKVIIFHEPKVGANIRCCGEDVKKGALILSEGTSLRPYEIALLASQGVSYVPVVRKPVVCTMATGDELVDVERELSPGMIRNSNGPALTSALMRWKLQCIDMGIVKDDPKEIEQTLRKALSQADVVLVSGGVSAGDYDYTRTVLKKIGIKEIFWKAAIKPGKPLLFGIYAGEEGREKPVFGMPGNPLSVLVCLEEFVRPAFEKMQGYLPKHPSYHLKGVVTNSYRAPHDRQQYIFCQVSPKNEGDFEITIIRPQGSAMIGMSCRANALAVVPVGLSSIKKGDLLQFRWLK